MYANQGNSNDDFDLGIFHYTEYLESKYPNFMLQLRLQRDICDCKDYIDFDDVEFVQHIGEVSFKAEHFVYAGNCFREACDAIKSFVIEDDMILFCLVEKAYVSYTIAKNKEKRHETLQEVISMMENVEHFIFLCRTRICLFFAGNPSVKLL